MFRHTCIDFPFHKLIHSSAPALNQPFKAPQKMIQGPWKWGQICITPGHQEGGHPHGRIHEESASLQHQFSPSRNMTFDFWSKYWEFRFSVKIVHLLKVFSYVRLQQCTVFLWFHISSSPLSFVPHIISSIVKCFKILIRLACLIAVCLFGELFLRTNLQTRSGRRWYKVKKRACERCGGWRGKGRLMSRKMVGQST